MGRATTLRRGLAHTFLIPFWMASMALPTQAILTQGDAIVCSGEGFPMKVVSVAAAVICTALIFALPRWTGTLPDILNLFLGILTGVVWFVVLLFAMSTLRGTE